VRGLTGLDLLPAGETAGAADRLWTREARAALDALTAGYDYCLFDSSALLDGSEALSLLHAVPDVLLVARAEQADEPALRQGLERLSRGGASARGVILNSVRRRARAPA
jgi:Mrp family chromosome partitioning ATPase